MKTYFSKKNMAWAILFSCFICFPCKVKAAEFINEDDDPYEGIISLQWGLRCPEGHTLLTEYRELAKSDEKAKLQYDELVNCISKAKQYRQKMLKKAFKHQDARFSCIESEAQAKIKKIFQDSGIELLKYGAYRLPDGTKVIENDPNTLNAENVCYHKKSKSNAPVMERDKSPNYDAHNEQTWPVYTSIDTCSTDYMSCQSLPEIYRGEDCTYVVCYNRIYWDFHWFRSSSESALIDRKSGTKYMVRYLEHFPLDTYYWVHGHEGQIIRRVFVYPPLPEDVTTVDYIPGRVARSEKLSNMSPHCEYPGLKVQSIVY